MRVLLVILCLLFSPNIFAHSDLDHAPPSFGARNGTVVPIDISTVNLDLEFDYSTRKATGKATINFSNRAPGFPLLDLVPAATNLTLDGVALADSQFETIDDPDRVSKYRIVRHQTPAGNHVLEMEYQLSSSDVTFTNGAVRVGFFMSDLTTGGRAFFEQYGPANIEFDQIKYTFNVEVTGTTTEHEIFTNGDISTHRDNAWTVEFPEYFTTSSLYFHMTEKNRFKKSEFTIQGMEKEIPVVVYASSSSNVSRGATDTRKVIAELESTYGPLLHKRLVIYVTPNGGGMEYGGATMTSLWALGHELTHFWFARGVMPSKGNSGWIDEAIASWRDEGYRRPNRGPSGSPHNLGGFSPYRRHTTRDAYSLGRDLIGEFDYLFRNQGGMKPVLKELFTEYAGETITVDLFKQHLEQNSGEDLTSIFDRYVYGNSRTTGFKVMTPDRFAESDKINHPRPYTKDEMKLYR